LLAGFVVLEIDALKIKFWLGNEQDKLRAGYLWPSQAPPSIEQNSMQMLVVESFQRA
jgi:hypothetical protein